MRAHLKSRGNKIWEINQDTSYVDPPDPGADEVTLAAQANDKALEILQSSLCESEFHHVCNEVFAHKVWTTPSIAHKGKAQVKAQLFETPQREYENSSQLPGESVETMLQRFTIIVNSKKKTSQICPIPTMTEL